MTALLNSKRGSLFSARSSCDSISTSNISNYFRVLPTPSLESLNNFNQGRYKHLTLDKRVNSAEAPNWNLIDLKTESIQCGIADSTLDAIGATLKAKQTAGIGIFKSARLCTYPHSVINVVGLHNVKIAIVNLLFIKHEAD